VRARSSLREQRGMSQSGLTAFDSAHRRELEQDGTPLVGALLRSARKLAAVLLFEFRRALAAERSYEAMRRKSRVQLVRTGVASADIARQVFDKHYSEKGPGLSR
jgi:hypothetical protein